MAFFGDLISNIKGLFWSQININGYVFDAYLRMSEQSELTITKSPVETGAAITDHAYRNPSVFTFDIGMTDTSLGKVLGQFGILNRSVNAYRKLKEWQENRTLVTLNSKYGFFNHILVKSIVTSDDYTTYNGMKATVTLEEVIITSTQLVKVSSASFYTHSYNRGIQNTTTPSQNVSSLVKIGNVAKALLN